MRISDWSSDVCSSDLPQEVRAPVEVVVERGELRRRLALGGLDVGLEGLLAGKHALQLFQHRRELRLHVLHPRIVVAFRSEEHTSELQSLMRISYAVFCLKKKKTHNQ